MTTYQELAVEFHAFFIVANFQLLAPVALSQATVPITQQTAAWVGPTTGLDAVTEKGSLQAPRMEARPPSLSHLYTELSGYINVRLEGSHIKCSSNITIARKRMKGPSGNPYCTKLRLCAEERFCAVARFWEHIT